MSTDQEADRELGNDRRELSPYLVVEVGCRCEQTIGQSLIPGINPDVVFPATPTRETLLLTQEPQARLHLICGQELR